MVRVLERWMSHLPLNRGVLAVALSVAVHLVVIVGLVSWRPIDDAPRPLTTPVLLVPVTPTLPEPPPLPPLPEPLPSEPTPSQEEPPPSRSPRLAAKLRATPQTSPVDTRLEDEPPVEPTAEPEPSPPAEPSPVVVALPSAREAARRQVVEELPPAPTDRQRVEARVVAMMREALPPPINDVSGLPDLRPDGEGNLLYENGALRATIAPDGSVTFGRRRGVGIDGLTTKSADPGDQAIRDLHTTIPGLPIPMTVFRASAADEAAGRSKDMAGLGVTLRPNSDLNDAILRAKGEDPLAAKKRRFLRRTRELRDKLADGHRGITLSHSKVKARRHLDRVWADESKGYATKRLLLFRLWDEAEELSSLDDERPEAKAGERARAYLLRLIRARLPAGSAEAFSPTELQRLNARRHSSQRFVPY